MADDSVGSVSVSVVPSAQGFNDKLKSQVLDGADETGRELGARIKEAAEAELAGLKAHIGADDDEAKAALDDLRAKAEGTDARIGVGVDPEEFLRVVAELDELKAKVDELNGKKADIDVTVNNSSGVRGWLTSLIAGAVAIAPAFAVAGIGIGAFAALAVPSLKAVAQYESDLGSNAGKAAADYALLTSQQREMVAGIGGLKAEFTDLSAAVRPEVLQVMNEALAAADRILPELVPLAEAGGRALAGLVNQLGDALGDSNAQQFFDFLSKSVGPDVQAIGATLASLIRTFFSLTEALQPVSLGLLAVVRGAAGLLDVISRVAPPLDDVIVLSIALYKPLKALNDLNLVSTFGNFAKALTGVAAASDAEGLKFGWLSGLSSKVQGIIATQRELAAAVVAAGEASAVAGAEYAAANAEALESQLALAASGTALTGVEEAIAAGELSAAEAGQALAISMSELSVLTEAVDAALAGEAVAAEAASIAMEELAAAEAEAAAASGLLDAVNPLAWVGLAVVAVGALVFGLSKLGGGFGDLTSQVEAQSGAVNFNTQGYFAAADALGKLGQSSAKTTENLVNLHTGMVTARTSAGDLDGETRALADAQAQMTSDGKNQLQFFGELSKNYGISRDAAIGFAQATGVTSDQINKGGKTLTDAVAKIAAYNEAERMAAKGAGEWTSNSAVLAFAANQQTSAVATLAQAWSTYVSALAGTQSSFDTYAQGMTTLAKDAHAAGASFGGLNAASLSFNSQFQSQVTNLQAVSTSLRESGVSSKVFDSGIRGGIASMIKFAGSNKTARAELLAVARQSDSNITSWKSLTEWAGNTATGTKRLQTAMDLGALSEAKMSQASKDVASALNSDVTAALARASLSASGFYGDVDKLTAAQKKYGDQSPQAEAAAKAVSTDMRNAGNSAHVAAGYIAGAGDSSATAGDKMQAAALKAANLRTAIDDLHSKTVDVNVVFNRSNIPNTGAGVTVPGAPTYASGGVHPGRDTGRDEYLVAVRGGEGMLVPPAVRALGGAPAIDAINRRYGGGGRNAAGHFAQGGIAETAQFAFPQDVFNINFGPIGIGAFGGTTGGGGVTGAPIFSQGSLDAMLPGELRKGVTASEVNDAGKALAKAFADGYKDTASQIRDDTKTALEDIRKYYSGPAATQLERTISTQGSALAKLATASDNLANKIADMKAYAAQETQSLQPFSDLSSIQPGQDANGNPIPITGTQISTTLAQDLATLKKFESVIVKLKNAGVDKVLIAQVIALGPADGVTYGDAILAGGKNLISTLNKEEKEIGAIDVKIGKKAADVQFGQPLAKGFLDGLDKEKSELEKRMKHLGDVLAKELQKALHDKTGTTSKAVASAAASYVAPAAATSISGSVGTSAFTRTDITEIRATLRTIENRELNLMTKAQAAKVIALLEAAPKATGNATGAAVAGELKSIAKSAAATARAATR